MHIGVFISVFIPLSKLHDSVVPKQDTSAVFVKLCLPLLAVGMTSRAGGQSQMGGETQGARVGRAWSLPSSSTPSFLSPWGSF